jgi:hypothetical protein
MSWYEILGLVIGVWIAALLLWVVILLAGAFASDHRRSSAR